ncbi:TPA: helix-turn-helix domain-containing protein [Pseudomonas aeruginosa]|uniref:XRE family transcriptional regulator n=1 Tax=Pseudomonas aeruginosa TaxID=287 RepID=UPI0018C49892|nr:helix-turn-helix domain-containing protein [Pseudomonas aeruginosa]MBG4273460.1 helix-turn-helix domain-containing protein [Pseudomonas aeruginosa]HEK3375686.1 helix-turn-helix domain-containing protein [Pseudomonas aeruginosa]
MRIGERIAQELGRLGWSEAELGRRTGISQPTVHRIISGQTSSPKQANVEAIARALNRTPHWLWHGTDLKAAAEKPHSDLPPGVTRLDIWDDSTPLDDDEVELPFYKEVELSGGLGSTVVREDLGRKVRFGRYSLRRLGIDPNNAACVTVSGNSMIPILPDGSTVGVDTGSTSIKDGDMYAIDHDGQLRVKQLYRLPGGGLRIRSFNSEEHPDERYTAEDAAEHVRIIGRVFWYSVLT